MARQRKSLDEQILVLDGQIDKLQSRMESLLQQREVLATRKREEELGELYEFMKENGVSIQELYHLIGQESRETEEEQQQETA